MKRQRGWDTVFSREDHLERPPHPWLSGIFRSLPVDGMLLDLGCGTGPNLPAAHNAGLRVWGSDISIHGLRRAQARIKAAGFNVPLVLADMATLPFAANRFDGLVSIQTINHGTPESIARTIAEIQRILKPGGKIFVTLARAHDHYPPNGYNLIAPHTVIPLAGPEKGLVHHFFTREEILNIFASFELETITRDPFDKWLVAGRHKLEGAQR